LRRIRTGGSPFRAYGKDFWSQLPDYVHVIAEKDAIAGVLQPVTREYDVPLSIVRGYVSVNFAYDVAQTWSAIDKPIYAYYLGDFDPSGFNLEHKLGERAHRHYDGPDKIFWKRLCVNEEDFDAFDLLPLEPKTTDSRYQEFIRDHGHQCAEVDALPMAELRRRVRDAIESHIP
jgi:hypothetical protein